jgi:hypothetical protein
VVLQVPVSAVASGCNSEVIDPLLQFRNYGLNLAPEAAKLFEYLNSVQG